MSQSRPIIVALVPPGQPCLGFFAMRSNTSDLQRRMSSGWACLRTLSTASRRPGRSSVLVRMQAQTSGLYVAASSPAGDEDHKRGGLAPRQQSGLSLRAIGRARCCPAERESGRRRTGSVEPQQYIKVRVPEFLKDFVSLTSVFSLNNHLNVREPKPNPIIIPSMIQVDDVELACV